MYKFSIFNQYPVTAVISSKTEGNIDSRFGSESTITQNLSKICGLAQLAPDSIIQMEQMPMTDVSIVDSSQTGQRIDGADGLITQDTHVTLMMRIADCVPIFIYDPTTQVIALIHSGWRGTVGKIALVAVQKMMSHFRSDPSNLLVALGPSIQQLSNVSTTPPLQSELPEWNPFISKVNNNYHIDLPGFIVKTLIDSGVKSSNIELSSIDTYANPHYFSHHKSQTSSDPEGRFAALFKLHEFRNK